MPHSHPTWSKILASRFCFQVGLPLTSIPSFNVSDHVSQAYTFTLFWLRKTSVIVETYQLSFHVFTCAFDPEISQFVP